MKPIRVPVTLSPHVVKGVPRGYYVLAQRLFPKGAPIIAKQQWIGFDGENLIVTAQHKPQCKSLLEMAVHHAGRTWLAPAKIWPMPQGFRSYIPASILKAKAGPRIVTYGIFNVTDRVAWLDIPKLNGEVLLGRKEL